MWNPFKRKQQQEVPTAWDLQQAFDYAPDTPDVNLLMQKQFQLLFVYNEMQQKHPSFDVIEEYTVPLCVAFTKDSYVMYKRKLGEESWAVALDESFFQAQKGLIKGELHCLKSERLIDLDTLYNNGVRFERRKVTVRVPHMHFGRKGDGGFALYKVTEIRCWAYIGIQEHWHKMMGEETEGFFLYERVRTFEPKNPDLTTYYHFSKLEYDDF